MGVLLFQDLAVIPLLVLVPALVLPGEQIAASMGLALAKAAAMLAVLLILGQRIMRPLFHLIAAQKSSELFVLAVLLVTLGLSWLTELAGLSMALGAFLAGMLISETEYRYQVEDYVKPFRDVLLGLFFVTIGMLLDFHVLWDHWLLAALVLAAMLVLKFIVVVLLVRWFGGDRAVALRCALALAPAGALAADIKAQSSTHFLWHYDPFPGQAPRGSPPVHLHLQRSGGLRTQRVVRGSTLIRVA